MRLPDFLLPKNTALGRLVAKRRSFEASPLSRNSVELHKSRLQTRRCTLDNCRCHAGSGTAASECTAVLPREDSITLAKRRLSVDVLSTSGCESAAPAAHDASTSSGSSVTAAAAAAAPAAAPTGVQWGSDTDSHCSCASTA